MKNKIIGLVAVRLDSKRLKKKAFLNLYYKKIIIRLFERISLSHYMNDIAICTSDHYSDNEIENIAKAHKIKVFRGSKKDVMSRFIDAGKNLSANHIVRITGDNPLTDPKIIDYLIKKHLTNKNEYTFSSSAPIGTKAEIIDFKTLKRCYTYLVDPNSSEYMSWMLNRPDVFKIEDVKCPKNLVKSNHISFTVDKKIEYENIKKIYAHFKGFPPKLNEIIKWIERHPNLLRKMKKKNIDPKIKNINCSFKFD